MERRSYARISADIPATVYVPEREEGYCCTITDISEQGIRLRFPLFEEISLRFGDVVMIQFSDTFAYGGKRETESFTLRSLVRHAEEKGGQVFVGCSFENRLFREYVTKKRRCGQLG